MVYKLCKTLKILIVFSLVLSLSGCWNRRELNTLAIVMGVGIDDVKDKDEINMTVQIVDTSVKKTSSKGSDSGGAAYINLNGNGTNVMTIYRDFTHEISRKLYIPHNQVIIFGEELAKNGVHDTLDFFMRDHEARLTVNILVAKGNAKDIFEAKPELATIPMSDLSSRIELQSATSETACLTVIELMNCLSSKTFSAVAPFVELTTVGDKKITTISGGAVFKGDKVVGELNRSETRGYLWVMNKVKSGTMRVDVNDKKATLEIVKGTSKVTPSIAKDGTITFKIAVKQSCTIANQTGKENVSKERNVKLIKTASEKLIKDEIESAISKAKELDSDIFGFGESINRLDSKKWKKLEGNWDEEFKKVKVEISVETTVNGAGRLAEPDYPESET